MNMLIHTISDEIQPNDSSFRQYKVYVDIRSGFFKSIKRQLRNRKRRFFSVFGRYIFGNLGNKANVII